MQSHQERLEERANNTVFPDLPGTGAQQMQHELSIVKYSNLTTQWKVEMTENDNIQWSQLQRSLTGRESAGTYTFVGLDQVLYVYVQERILEMEDFENRIISIERGEERSAPQYSCCHQEHCEKACMMSIALLPDCLLVQGKKAVLHESDCLLPVKNWLEPQCKIPNWFEPSQCEKHQKCSKMYLNFRINAPILFFPLLRI